MNLEPLADLRDWIMKNRPELFERLAPLHISQIRPILNEETGLEIQGNDRVDTSCIAYLQALKAKQP